MTLPFLKDKYCSNYIVITINGNKEKVFYEGGGSYFSNTILFISTAIIGLVIKKETTLQ